MLYKLREMLCAARLIESKQMVVGFHKQNSTSGAETFWRSRQGQQEEWEQISTPLDQTQAGPHPWGSPQSILKQWEQVQAKTQESDNKRGEKTSSGGEGKRERERTVRWNAERAVRIREKEIRDEKSGWEKNKLLAGALPLSSMAENSESGNLIVLNCFKQVFILPGEVWHNWSYRPVKKKKSLSGWRHGHREVTFSLLISLEKLSCFS